MFTPEFFADIEAEVSAALDGVALRQLLDTFKLYEIERVLTPDSVSLDETWRTRLHETVQALARAYLAARPGASPQEFIAALRRGCAPSAGLAGDTDPLLQAELVQVLDFDPGLLDG